MIDVKFKIKFIFIKYEINIFWILKKKCFKLFKKKNISRCILEMEI